MGEKEDGVEAECRKTVRRVGVWGMGSKSNVFKKM